jgi:hypothetical protein
MDDVSKTPWVAARQKKTTRKLFSSSSVGAWCGENARRIPLLLHHYRCDFPFFSHSHTFSLPLSPSSLSVPFSFRPSLATVRHVAQARCGLVVLQPRTHESDLPSVIRHNVCMTASEPATLDVDERYVAIKHDDLVSSLVGAQQEQEIELGQGERDVSIYLVFATTTTTITRIATVVMVVAARARLAFSEAALGDEEPRAPEASGEGGLAGHFLEQRVSEPCPESEILLNGRQRGPLVLVARALFALRFAFQVLHQVREPRIVCQVDGA